MTAMLCMAVSYAHANSLADSGSIPTMTSTYSIWKVVASLIFIIAFIPASLWVVKKLQFAQMRLSKSDIRIISSQSLGAKEKLILVEVEGEKILIGVTSHSINHIKSFTPNSKAFAQLMGEAPLQDKADDNIAQDESVSPRGASS